MWTYLIIHLNMLDFFVSDDHFLSIFFLTDLPVVKLQPFVFPPTLTTQSKNRFCTKRQIIIYTGTFHQLYLSLPQCTLLSSYRLVILLILHMPLSQWESQLSCLCVIGLSWTAPLCEPVLLNRPVLSFLWCSFLMSKQLFHFIKQFQREVSILYTLYLEMWSQHHCCYGSTSVLSLSEVLL